MHGATIVVIRKAFSSVFESAKGVSRCVRSTARLASLDIAHATHRDSALWRRVALLDKAE